MRAAIEYHRPATLEEAWSLAAARPGARFIAGGTDVMVRLREGKERPSALISLRRIAELSCVDDGPPILIGAGVRIADLATNPTVAQMLPVMIEAARCLGSVQIRNAATIGGNLCNASPCADLAPPLLVHEAAVNLARASGMRTLPLAEFFSGPRKSVLAPDEILQSIMVEPPAPGARAIFLKKGRVQMDIALASMAILLELDGRRCVSARVAAGSVAPTPLRLFATEELLEGSELDEATIASARRSAEDEVRPISDVRASADYRRHLAGALLERAVRALSDGGRR